MKFEVLDMKKFLEMVSGMRQETSQSLIDLDNPPKEPKNYKTFIPSECLDELVEARKHIIKCLELVANDKVFQTLVKAEKQELSVLQYIYFRDTSQDLLENLNTLLHIHHESFFEDILRVCKEENKNPKELLKDVLLSKILFNN